MEDLLRAINGVLWSSPVVYTLLGVGLLFSILTRFSQVRHIKDMFVLMFTGKKSDAGVSSFQALSVALAGRVGTGNIAGVASAIFYGGPGAVFWMWAIAFLGASSAFIESTLAQVYKDKYEGQYRGGPAFYIEKGMGTKWFGIIFAIAALIAMSILMPGVQSNAIAAAVDNAFAVPPWVTGLVLVLFLGLIILGGIKWIATTASFIVPFMAIAYMLMAGVIIGMNITAVPETIQLIVSSAFGMDSIFGGLLGSAIAWGVMRGVYSNEAGQGTGAHAAAAAEVSHPAKQGLVQSASVYIDTLLICSATAFMILFTGMYNTTSGGDNDPLVVEGIPGATVGPEFTQGAINSVFPAFGTGFVAIALLFFAFTTIMAYYYIAETNIAYLMRGRKAAIPMFLIKIVLLGATYFGAVRTAENAWLLGDIGLGLMVWINVIAILILAKPALQCLKDYEEQKKQGLDPVFNPKKLGIKNATFWETYVDPEKRKSS